MIQFKNISKTFESKTGIVHAVKDVNLEINSGEIFGVIGYSGAGKSTLVRLINLLERPTQGSIYVSGKDITQFNESQLRERRKKIGMIFQQFNLLSARNVFENIALPLKRQGLSKEEIHDKVIGLLELVGILDKAKAYPSQLSGGQKQRVAIARALANDPDILLCDEATSALDPQTTKTILKLIKDLNEKLKLTVVVITHEMEVVKEICDRVAVMEDGNVVELNTVQNIFSNPQENITREFINSTSNLNKLSDLIQNESEVIQLQAYEKLLRIDFVGESTSDAIISKISKEYDTEASIIFANVEVIKDEILGSMVIKLSGESNNQDAAIKHLAEIGIKVEVIKHGPVVN